MPTEIVYHMPTEIVYHDQKDQKETDSYNFLLTSNNSSVNELKIFEKEVKEFRKKLVSNNKIEPAGNIQKKIKTQHKIGSEQCSDIIKNNMDTIRMYYNYSKNMNFLDTYLSDVYAVTFSFAKNHVAVDPEILETIATPVLKANISMRIDSRGRKKTAVNSCPIFEQFRTIMLR